MWTLAQWKQARRVDHFKVLAWNIRYRGTPDQQLKAFDQLVADSHAAQTNQAKCYALGEILARAAVYRQGAHAARTQNPVATLAAAAEQDLRLLLAGHDVNADAALNDLKADPATWGTRQVHINTWIVVPNGQESAGYAHVDAMIDSHVAAANSLYASAGMRLSVVRSNAASPVVSRKDATQPVSPANALLDLAPDLSSLSNELKSNPVYLATIAASAGTFSERSRGRVATYLATQAKPNNSIDLVYVPAFAEDDAQGLTTRPNSVGLEIPPRRPFVTIRWTALNGIQFPSAATTFPTTLAHELLHALMDEGSHTPDANNLMAGGADRNGTNTIGMGQMAVARNSTYI